MPEFVGTLKPPRLAAAPSSPALGQLYYDTGANILYWWNGTAWIPAQAGSGAAGDVRTVTQSAHGFVVGNILYYNGTVYALAQADTAAHAEVVGIVDTVVDANNFVLRYDGHVAGLSGLTPGNTYYLSSTTAGALTTVVTAVVGQVAKPLLVADSATGGYWQNWRGEVIAAAAGGTTDLNYDGDYVAGTYHDGDIVIYNGVSYMAVKTTTNPPTPWQQQGTLPIPQSALVPIADIKLTSPQTTIDIPGIAQSFAHLHLLISARDTAATAQILGMQFNGDAGTTYNWEVSTAIATTQTNAETLNGTYGRIGRFPGTNSPVGSFSTNVVDINDYTSATNHKTVTARTASREGTASGSITVENNSFQWSPATPVPVTRITLTTSGFQFAAGTRVTLYGVLGTLQSSIAALTVPVAATTLPPSPQDGQQAILVDNTAAPTYSWLLQWSATASRWLGLPGAGAFSEVMPLESTTSATYVNLTTTGPQFTCPRAGLYEVSWGMQGDPNGVAGNQALMTIKVGAAAAGDTNTVTSRSSDLESVARTSRFTVNAGDLLLAQYRATGGTCRWQMRWLSVKPVYVT